MSNLAALLIKTLLDPPDTAATHVWSGRDQPNMTREQANMELCRVVCRSRNTVTSRLCLQNSTWTRTFTECYNVAAFVGLLGLSWPLYCSQELATQLLRTLGTSCKYYVGSYRGILSLDKCQNCDAPGTIARTKSEHMVARRKY